MPAPALHSTRSPSLAAGGGTLLTASANSDARAVISGAVLVAQKLLTRAGRT
jgi:hypothetical protein